MALRSNPSSRPRLRAHHAVCVGLLAVLAGSLYGACRRSVPEDRAGERFAGDVCNDIFRCDCNPPSYTSEGECQAQLESDFLQIQADAIAAGLEYDGHCAALWIDAYGGLDCDSTFTDADAIDILCDTLICPVYHGSADLGDPCNNVNGGSDCDAGLACLNGTCQQFDCNLRAGDTCFDGNDFLGYCRTDLACDLLVSGTCVDAPRNGDPCPGYICASGLYCNPSTLVCTNLPTLGESCAESGFCENADCNNDVCEPGEPIICGV